MGGKSPDFDVIIVGGGPAGMSAALWCVDLGLNAAVFEKEDEFGGQLRTIFNPIQNYIGSPAGNGKELNDRFLEHLKDRKFTRYVNAGVVRVDPTTKRVFLADGTGFSARAIILATGVRRRKLGVPGEDGFRGRGILESGAGSKDAVVGKTILVVGGGDAALENALILAEMAKQVILVHRGSEFTARPQFIENVRRSKAIRMCMNTAVTEIVGTTAVEAVKMRSAYSDETVEMAVENVLIRIGVQPNSDLVRFLAETDERGYITINAQCQTSIPGLFAVGDIANPTAPTISSATGQASTAVKVIVDGLFGSALNPASGHFDIL